MKILLLYPPYPETFWSFKTIVRFSFKKAAFPPLGLLTVAAFLPKEWEKRLFDMNTTRLKDSDLAWADYIFISAMIVQREAVKKLLKRCQGYPAKIVAGGPLFTTGFAESGEYEEFSQIDHLVLNEAEETLPLFLSDLEKGQARRIYKTENHPDLNLTPVPLWGLISLNSYACMSVQYSRGCPFDCEFCDIVIIDGHVPRTKSPARLLAEFDALYRKGWRGMVFIVDDNFIGNKSRVKALLPHVIDWMKRYRYPFTFITEASMDLAEDDELIRLMVEAGFNTVFLGLETPEEKSLAECNKIQNRGLDLKLAVKKIQNAGMEVMGGFIIGFDNDPPSIFDRQIELIQESGVVAAMVGLLHALPGTKLYNRLKRENRLLRQSSGDNLDTFINFVPKLDPEVINNGYKRILTTIYSPPVLYERILLFLKQYKPARTGKLKWQYLTAFISSIVVIGILSKKNRPYYWRLLGKTLFKYPRSFPKVVTNLIYSYHFQKVADIVFKKL